MPRLRNEGGGHPNFSRSSSYSGQFYGEPLDKQLSKKPIPMRKLTSQPELLTRDKSKKPIPMRNLEAPPFYHRIAAPVEAGNKKVSAKMLVKVTIAESIGPLRVLLCEDATVVEVIKAALAMYMKEGRRPILTSDPLSFGLHYSQFTIDCLTPELKMKDLGSRNFFLCPKRESLTPAVSCRTEMETFSRLR
ncbi:hypothetical protein SUGI_0978060 [Cryptomeria japonica]|uniref:uncharacterized protein At4g22758 n=1 Tax=Cryptomeria japonica TaxID=3369 RepID=UPI002414C55D|nr:uncharacterized protein At4g22758 [Cryptomeria japonica]GLJ46410.1 hypothetical protein SUGI_0978060 [Cryptomeria japonica]